MAVVTIFVSNMDHAIQFYTNVLGMKLLYRFGDEWSTLKTDDGVTIGLHPATKDSPAGKKGSITIGFEAPETIEKAVAAMKAKGVTFTSAIQDDKQVKAANFADPDGNEMYIVEVQRQWSQHKEHTAA